MKIVELGCGPNKKDLNSIGIDRLDLPGVDVVADLNKGLPFFEDNSIDEIYSYHVLEHVGNLNFLFEEVYRVLKENGIFHGAVPYFSNPYNFSDPTHVKSFTIYTFSYFSKSQYSFNRRVPSFYNNLDFKIDFIYLKFKTARKPSFFRKQLKRVIEKIVNKNRYLLELYEEVFCYLFPAYELHFKLRK